MCPSMAGGNNYFPPSYSQRTRLIYIPSMTTCNEATLDQEVIKKGVYFSLAFKNIERSESELSSSTLSPAKSRRRRMPLSEQQRCADDRGRPRLHRPDGRHFHRL